MSIYAIRNGLRTWAQINPADYGWGARPFPVILTPDHKRGVYAIPRCGSVSLILAMAEAHYPKAAEALRSAMACSEPWIHPELAYRLAEEHGMMKTDLPENVECYAVIRHPISRAASALQFMTSPQMIHAKVNGMPTAKNEILLFLTRSAPQMVDVHFRPYFIGLRENVTRVFRMEDGGMQEVANLLGLEIGRENKTEDKHHLDLWQQMFVANMYAADCRLWDAVIQGAE